MAETIGIGIRENDYVYITNDAAKKFSDIAKKMGQGGVVKKIQDGIAEVHVTSVVRINISNLTTGKNAFNPIS